MSKLLKDKAYVNGEWIAADSGKTFEITNPATEKKIGALPDLGEHEAERAVDAAHDALAGWSSMLATERQEILEKWYDLIHDHIDDLTEILTMEQGKPHKEARGEILNGAGFIKWYAEEGRRIYGDQIPSNSADQRIVVIKQPVGVAAMITPWNFPSSMITRKVAPALGAGCTVVVKPSEATPYSAIALAVLAEKAGIPKGVFNIVTGDAKTIGKVLTSHKKVKKFSFTGSTAVGKKLMEQCADTVKKVSLELGGNAPFIVFEDADLKKAVTGTVTSKFRNAGQTCICANRIFVQENIYDEFLKMFVSETKSLKLGRGDEDSTDIGPMINRDGLEKTQELLKDALDDGAELHCGGNARDDLGPRYFEPTVITGVKPSMRIFKEEIFGPVAAVYKFSTTDEVIKMANDTQYGLAAYIYTNDLKRSWEVPEALEYGMVGVNSSLLSLPQAPFGGVKQSGFGREGAKYGIEDYIQTKYLSVQF